LASVGFAGALGADALSQAIRQQMIDKLSKQQIEHGMSVEDQKLALEKQRFDQEAQDRALLRQQQGTAFNEGLAEKTAANLTPQSIISPELATRFKNTSLAPLISPDQTLPSTSMAGGSALPGADVPSTAPALTQNAPMLTGQLRYAGTPKQIETNREQQAQRDVLSSPLLKPEQRLAFQAENSGLKVPSNVFEQKDTSALDAARIQALTANAETAAARAQAAGDNAALRAESERAKIELERAKLDLARRMADDKEAGWTPVPGAQVVRDNASGVYAYPMVNKRGETKLLPLPAGSTPEKPPQGGIISDWFHSWFGGSSPAAGPQVWVRGADGKLHPQ